MKNNACTHCHTEFEITPQDTLLMSILGISTLHTCSHCNFIERMIWRNERSFFNSINSARPDEKIISIYHPQSDVVVYDQKSWWGDSWDAKNYGKDIDFSKPFFEQWKELFYSVPFPNLLNWNSVNSEYCNCTGNSKNCYMCFGGDSSEDCLYNMYDMFCTQTLDSYWAIKCNLCYELVLAENCYKVFFGFNVKGCRDSYFLTDCTNCSDCIGCVGLKNAQYYILNEKYSKEAYFEKKKELALNTFNGLKSFKDTYKKLVQIFPQKYARIINSYNTTGDRIQGSKDIANSFDVVTPAENIKDCNVCGWNLKDTLRSSQVGFGAEMVYNSFGVFSAASKVYCSAYCPSASEVWYSYNCQAGFNLFGCVGLKKGEYCILNKQYTKEAYLELLPKIKEHMKNMPYIDKRGKQWNFGDFFPSDFSPFSYNESMAIDIYPKTEEQILVGGFIFRPREKNVYTLTKKVEEISTIDINTIEPRTEIFECKNQGEPLNCPGAFRITDYELYLYKTLNIPVPEYCFNCRHYERFSHINKYILTEKQCTCSGLTEKSGLYKNTSIHHHGESPCMNIFQTTITDKNAIIYCEKCYQQEVI